MSTERLTPDSLTPQDKEWEANMLSFVERNEGNGTPIAPRKQLPMHRRTQTVILSAAGQNKHTAQRQNQCYQLLHAIILLCQIGSVYAIEG